MSATTPPPDPNDRKKRAVTAGLSAVGATAGAAGLGYAGYKTGQAFRAAKGPVLRRLGTAVKHEKFGAALVPLEVAGLGGEVMATKILHSDAKKQQQGVPVTKSLGLEQPHGHGRRIVEEPRVIEPKPDGAGIGVGRKEEVAKARRFDPEADRQRRLGAYAGLAGGGAIVVGDQARREFGHTKVSGPKGAKALHVGFKPGRTRRGLLLTGAATGLAALSGAAMKRGVSERNQTWS